MREKKDDFEIQFLVNSEVNLERNLGDLRVVREIESTSREKIPQKPSDKINIRGVRPDPTLRH